MSLHRPGLEEYSPDSMESEEDAYTVERLPFLENLYSQSVPLSGFSGIREATDPERQAFLAKFDENMDISDVRPFPDIPVVAELLFDLGSAEDDWYHIYELDGTFFLMKLWQWSESDYGMYCGAIPSGLVSGRNLLVLENIIDITETVRTLALMITWDYAFDNRASYIYYSPEKWCGVSGHVLREKYESIDREYLLAKKICCTYVNFIARIPSSGTRVSSMHTRNLQTAQELLDFIDANVRPGIRTRDSQPREASSNEPAVALLIEAIPMPAWESD